MIDADHPGIVVSAVALTRFLRSAQKQVGLAGEVNVLVTSNEKMRRLNREFRGKDKPTDVLSFPSSVNGKSGIAGDIAISAQIARANAEALGHPLESELKILLLHGLLHLAGYDHESDNGKMARLEQRLRGRLKLPASLIERNAPEKGTISVVPRRAGDLAKRTTSVVPSGSRNNLTASLPQTAARRRRSGRKETFPFVAPGKALRSGLRQQGTKSRRAAGAKSRKTRNKLNGKAEAVPFPGASSPRASLPKASSAVSFVVNQRTARRYP